MTPFQFNLVSFKPYDSQTPEGEATVEVFLKLDSEWVRRAGLEPDVNSAVLPFKEFDKLIAGDKLMRDGVICFYFTSDETPDVTIPAQQIVNVDPVLLGTVLSEGDDDDEALPVSRVIEYRLFFADSRRRWKWPRGGRLFDGD